jgi:hypothetical protein
MRCCVKTPRFAFARHGGVPFFAVVLSCVIAHAQDDNKYACSGPNPQSPCNTSNPCGSSPATCIVNVKRGDNGPSVMPGIPSAKRNGTFFAKTDTTIVLMSTQKNSGFVGNPGSSSPFGFHDATVGGAKRPVSVAARNAGWYSEGACISGVVPGLCGPGRPMLLLWRQSSARHDSRPRHSSADPYACQRFAFARNQRPSHRGNRHNLFCNSSFLEMWSDTGVIFGTARNGSWARPAVKPVIVEQRAFETSRKAEFRGTEARTRGLLR